ncbi:MAG: hypothetical protein EXQ70_05365 [Solirubrobacterales bacterium]|nr:hypothetical protein [Solirubrobacterales bacterium]
MFAAYVSALVLIVASLLIGRSIFKLLGREETTWLEPVVGFAVLCVVGSGSARLLDSAGVAAAVCGLLALGGLIVLRGRVVDARILRLGIPAALVAIALASLPFIASGGMGILGVGVNNDLASHLLWADWLQHQPHPTPTGVANGYPVGPHSLMAVLGVVFGFSMTEAVVGLLFAVAGITAISTMAALGELPGWKRLPSAVLVALAYPAASAFAVGGFKENVMALFLLGFALALWRLERNWAEPDRATLVALGLIPAGIISAYSYQGLYWVIASAGLLAAIGGLRALRAGRLREELRRAVPVAGIPLAVFLVIASTELVRARTFNDVSGVRIVVNSNAKLRESISPFEALGSWPSSDFLLGNTALGGHLLFAALGLAALALGLWWWLRRGALALPVTLLGAGLIYLATLSQAGLYVQSKALLVPGPLVMLIILRGLLATRAEPAEASDEGAPGAGSRIWNRIGSPPGWLTGGLAVVFVAVAAYSSFLALRDAVVAPNAHADELASIREDIGDDWVLSLTSDRFTDYFLESTRVGSPTRNAQQVVRSRTGKSYRLPLDFDSVDYSVLDAFPWVLTTRARYRSAPPSSLELYRSTPSYELWRRVGPAAINTRVFGEEARPGKVLNCGKEDIATGEKRELATTATIISPPPAIGKREDWDPSGTLAPGGSASQALELKPGTWELSLQYQSPLVGIRVKAPGLDIRLPSAMDGAIPFRFGQGPFWPAGRVEVRKGGLVRITAEADGVSGIPSLLGVDPRASIGNIVAVQPGTWRRVPFRDACGEYVDHYRVPPGNVKKKPTIVLPPPPIEGVHDTG